MPGGCSQSVRVAFRRISKAFPLDYYWLWTDEGWTWQTPKPEVIEGVKRDSMLAR